MSGWCELCLKLGDGGIGWHIKALVTRRRSRSEKDMPQVIPPFLTGCIGRTYAAIFNFWAGVMPPMRRCPAMVGLQTMRGMSGRSLL